MSASFWLDSLPQDLESQPEIPLRYKPEPDQARARIWNQLLASGLDISFDESTIDQKPDNSANCKS